MVARNIILSAGVGLLLALAAQPAQAVAIVGTGDGTFSSAVCLPYCATTNNGRTVEWGSDSFWSTKDPSTLTSQHVDIATNTSATGVTLARLDWYNSDNTYWNPDLAFHWSLTVSFTKPNASSDTELFGLTILNRDGPDTLGGLELQDLANLSFSLNGVIISNLHYEVADVDGRGGTTSFSNGVWSNDEDNRARLYIKADFTAIAADPPPARIPEPGSLALIGVGLLGVGFLRRLRHR